MEAAWDLRTITKEHKDRKKSQDKRSGENDHGEVEEQ
jgi:hypothetical protein